MERKILLATSYYKGDIETIISIVQGEKFLEIVVLFIFQYLY